MELERSIREEFTVFLSDETFKSSVIDLVDVVHIFGFYSNNISQFKFFPGHKVNLEKLANEVKSQGKEYYNLPAEYKMPRKNIIRSPIGYLFGVKTPMQCDLLQSHLEKGATSEMVPSTSKSTATKPTPIVVDEPNPNLQVTAAKSKLLERMTLLLEPFKMNITDADINMVNNGPKVVANVICRLCEKEEKTTTITVQYSRSQVNHLFYWNTSNFGKHLMLQHNMEGENKNQIAHQKRKSKQNKTPLVLQSEESAPAKIKKESGAQKRKNEQVEPMATRKSKRLKQMNTNETTESSTPKYSAVEASVMDDSGIIIENTINSSETLEDEPNLTTMTQDDLTAILVTQLSEQNLFLKENTKKMAHLSSEMKFMLKCDRTIEVIELQKDGNCLFAALVHQIFGHNPGTKKSNTAVKSLRKQVVAHIIKKFDYFQFQIIGRLYEERDAGTLTLQDDIQKQAVEFVSNILARDGIFGGAETIKAVSELHDVNIVAFIENETCRFNFDFNPNFKRTVAIAYRLSHLPDKPADHHNHYDSIKEIGQHILFDTSVTLSKMEMNRSVLKEAPQLFIGLPSQ